MMMMMNAGKDSVKVMLTDEIIYNSTTEHHAGNTYEINNRTRIQVIDISKYKIKVSMKNIQFTLPNAVLQNILEQHGEVESLQRCRFVEMSG